MATLLLHHPSFANHQTGHGHPERPDRYRAVQAVLDRPEFDPLVREEAELADLDSTRQVHSNRYVDELEAARRTWRFDAEIAGPAGQPVLLARNIARA